MTIKRNLFIQLILVHACDIAKIYIYINVYIFILFYLFIYILHPQTTQGPLHPRQQLRQNCVGAILKRRRRLGTTPKQRLRLRLWLETTPNCVWTPIPNRTPRMASVALCTRRRLLTDVWNACNSTWRWRLNDVALDSVSMKMPQRLLWSPKSASKRRQGHRQCLIRLPKCPPKRTAPEWRYSNS